jgi:hypothetical protein
MNHIELIDNFILQNQSPTSKSGDIKTQGHKLKHQVINGFKNLKL